MSRHLFETPIFVFDIPQTEAMVASLGRLLREEAATTPGLVVSNRHGWHSIPDLALRPEPVFRDMCAMLVEHFRYATDYTARNHGTRQMPEYGLALTAWAVVMERGAYTVVHDHPEATWSSAFYVDAGDPPSPEAPDSGLLTFVDPRRASSPVIGLDLFPTHSSVQPKTSRLVIFPGYLQHHVHPYVGARARICVAANATIKVTGPPRTA
jgi:uncharacterized protein (TIGR02466 family)